MPYTAQWRLAVAVAMLIAVVTVVAHLEPVLLQAAGLNPSLVQAWATILLSIFGAIALFLPRLQATPTRNRVYYEAALKSKPGMKRG